jgi:ATP-dependent phosphofructokinase / diphosphate-dependent phosphofructokinase
MNQITGKAVIAQGGGPTAVINQSLVGAVLQARRYPQITNFYGAKNGVEGLMNEEFIDLTQASTHNLELVARTPGAGLRSSRKRPDEDDCARIFQVLKAHDIHYFFFIGGNDSAETCLIVNENARKAGYDLRVIHVPKTIDNDILVTDHCPGYGSAARFVAQAFAGINHDNQSLPGVFIGVVMGRNAGFLTAASVFAKKYDNDGPHLIYLPERTFSPEKFVTDVENVMSKFGWCVVAVSEGIVDEGNNPIVASLTDRVERDAHGNIQLSGVTSLGDALRDLIKTRLNYKRVRADTFGYIQRSFLGCVSEVDAYEAREVGEWALQFATWNRVDGSIVIERVGDYAVQYNLVELSEVTGGTKVMPDHFIEGNNGVTVAFKNYARPLLSALPEHERIHAPNVPKVMKK